MKKSIFVTLLSLLFFTANAQSDGEMKISKSNFYISLGTISGVSYEYFLNDSWSLGADLGVPFKFYFSSPSVYNIHLKTELPVSTNISINKYFGTSHNAYKRSGWLASLFLNASYRNSQHDWFFWKKSYAGTTDTSKYPSHNSNSISYKDYFSYSFTLTSAFGYSFSLMEHSNLYLGIEFPLMSYDKEDTFKLQEYKWGNQNGFRWFNKGYPFISNYGLSLELKYTYRF